MKLTLESLKEIIKEVLTEASFGRTRQKMQEQKFVIVSAFRDYRSKKENLRQSKQMGQDISAAGFSYTRVQGGYAEPEIFGGENGGEGAFHMIDPEGDGSDIIRRDVMENSFVITPEARPDVERTTDLFDLGVSLAQAYDQDSFIYGAPRTTEDPRGRKVEELLIAAYDQAGTRINQPWAGPWSSLEAARKDDIYFTKIAGKKGTLREHHYVTKLLHLRMSDIDGREDAMKKQYLIRRYKSILKEIRREKGSG
jgi:hypothetical protein